MSIEQTFGIIKPNAVQDGNIGNILSAIEKAGFQLRAMRMARLTPAICKGFYAEHVGKGFYQELEDFMCEGPVVLLCLEAENAVQAWRDLMGATNPANAAEGTLRKLYAASLGRNAVHGSDAPASAARELSYFFNAFDRV
jgi:nucleoside-diphosphate kinase